ncbi:MAG: winged helix-turn-helix transcriptional regulator [Thermoplasmatota archaeon]
MDDEATMREQVMATIRQFPGIHLRGLVRELSTTTSLARYHLQLLEEQAQVRAVDLGGFVRYFPRGGDQEVTKEDQQALHVLRQERPLEIALALLEMGAMQHRDLLEVVGGSKGNLTYHLDKLIEGGLVHKVSKGPERGFHLSDADRLRALLSKYEPVPDLLAQVSNTWDDLFSGHRRG